MLCILWPPWRRSVSTHANVKPVKQRLESSLVIEQIHSEETEVMHTAIVWNNLQSALHFHIQLGSWAGVERFLVHVIAALCSSTPSHNQRTG